MVSKRPEVLLLVGMSGAGRSASSNVFRRPWVLCY